MSALARAFRDLADWAAGSSPLYAHLARHAASDAAVLELAGLAPPDRSPESLLLAAVHEQLLAGADHPLAVYYPSVVADPRPPDEDLGPQFTDFCRRNAAAIEPVLRTRRTQTNAVRRCAVLYPALAHVASQVDGPLALVELGPSAGLNLLFDRYAYEYSAADNTAPTTTEAAPIGATDSPMTIQSAVRAGDPPLPAQPPAIHSRRGLDLNPLDVTDAADCRWMRALTWPEHHERRRLLAAAIDVARENPPSIRQGDVATDIPSVLDKIPTGVPVCVLDTLVLFHVPTPVRERTEATLRELAGERDLHWLAGEDELADSSEGFRLEWTRETAGGVETDLLAGFHPHGEWIEWHG